jgi:hypothetical protein
MSQQGVSANIIPNSTAAIFSPKKMEQRQKQQGYCPTQLKTWFGL